VPMDRPSSSKAVLVVEDEIHVRSLLVELLREEGHDVYEAANGRLALEILNQRAFDLIISDIKMPELDGRALYHELLRCQPELVDRLVIVTGYNNADTEFFLRETGVRVLRKPFSAWSVSGAV
jgi:two-component system, NtrC family, sensor kinase